MAQMTELEALNAVDTALSSLDDGAKLRVLSWANAKYLEHPPVSGFVQQQTQTAASGTRKKKTAAKASSPKKAKAIIKQDKSLALNPSGKTSAVDFVKEKIPTTIKEKCVVAVYYLLNVLELPAATVDQVYTLFKHVGWEAPADLRNALQQAGSAGWLDTAVGTDLKITSSGENLVEHKLPKPSKGGSK